MDDWTFDTTEFDRLIDDLAAGLDHITDGAAAEFDRLEDEAAEGFDSLLDWPPLNLDLPPLVWPDDLSVDEVKKGKRNRHKQRSKKS